VRRIAVNAPLASCHARKRDRKSLRKDYLRNGGGVESAEFGIGFWPLTSYSERMGWGFRKSINFGPLRINASKSGLGYSIGGRGFRIGRDARGRQYRSFSIPGTGIFNRTYTNTRSKATKPPVYSPTPTTSTNQTVQGKAQQSAIGKIALYFFVAALIYVVLTAVLHLF
jgi:hypothetical protein